MSWQFSAGVRVGSVHGLVIGRLAITLGCVDVAGSAVVNKEALGRHRAAVSQVVELAAHYFYMYVCVNRINNMERL